MASPSHRSILYEAVGGGGRAHAKLKATLLKAKNKLVVDQRPPSSTNPVKLHFVLYVQLSLFWPVSLAVCRLASSTRGVRVLCLALVQSRFCLFCSAS